MHWTRRTRADELSAEIWHWMEEDESILLQSYKVDAQS